MKTGSTEDRFKDSGDIHDAENTEMEEMEKKYSSSYTPPTSSFKPFTSEPVNEKSYAKPNIKIPVSEASQSIPEPTIMPPPLTKKEDNKQPGAKKPEEPVNKKMSELPSQEKQMAAKQAAAMAINMYEGLHQLGNHAVSINERKVKKLVRKNMIDTSIPIPVGKRVLSMTEFISAYNEEVSDTFSVSDKFKEDITPVLERVFEKKGIGATDEQTLMYMFGKDIVVKGFTAVALMRSRKETLNQLIELTEAYRGAQNGRTNEPQMQPTSANATPNEPKAKNSRPEYQPMPSAPKFQKEEIIEAETITNEKVFEEFDFIPEAKDEVIEIGDNAKKKRGRPRKNS